MTIVILFSGTEWKIWHDCKQALQTTKHFRKVSLGEALFGVDVMLSFSIINLLIGDHISGVDILVFDNCLFLSAMYVGHCL
jgi:hypothetical protein